MTRFMALILTVLTGFSGLVYEVAWQKSLATLLGSHGEATAAVLAIYLGGLSLGYAVFGRLSQRRMRATDQTGGSPRLLLIYGGVEATIGLWAFAFPMLFAAAQSVSIWLPFQHDPAAFVSDVVLTALLIGPPAVLMGGTIPLLTQALARDLADATRFHALVYGGNAAGAFAGALAAAFVLIPNYGIADALRAMGTLNLIAGGTFALLGARERRQATAVSAREVAAVRIEGFGFIAAAALLLGFAMMSIQTVLIRVGGLAFGASHFTFAMVVAVFVLCIAVGSLIVSALDRISSVVVVLCPVLLAASLVLLYPFVDWAPWAAHMIRSVYRDEEIAFLPFQGAAFLGILAVIWIPVGLSGASLPLLFHELRRTHGELGSMAGRLYSWNTVGNLLGALLGGYVLLHWFDLHHVYRVGVAAVVVAAGLLLTRLIAVPRVPLVLGGVAVLVGLVALPGWSPDRMSSGFFRLRRPSPEDLEGPNSMRRKFMNGARVVFHDDDPTTTVTVTSVLKSGERRSRSSFGGGQSTHRSLSILTNGKSDGSLTSDYTTMSMLALLPCLVADSCKDAFVIGFGTGVTVGEFAALESIESVTVAEISRGVLEAAPLFDGGNLNASRSPKVRLERGDAYRILLRDEGPYDVIGSEPPNPWVAGVEMLYSREFLEAARDRLRPGGIYAQWIHLYEIDRESVELVLRTYNQVFDQVAVWYATGADLLLLGLPPGARLDLERVEARMQQKDLAAGLRRAGIDSLPSLLAHEILPVGVLRAAALQGEVHTLWHPRLSDLAARAFFVGRAAILPPTASEAAIQLGRRHSLLHAWIERERALSPSIRKELLHQLCATNFRPECATVLASWLHAEPDSPELAESIDRFAPTLEPMITRLATLFGDGPPGPTTPAQVMSWTELFADHYYHGVPFNRSALDAIWRECHRDGCARARREAGALLGDAPSGVAGR